MGLLHHDRISADQIADQHPLADNLNQKILLRQQRKHITSDGMLELKYNLQIYAFIKLTMGTWLRRL